LGLLGLTLLLKYSARLLSVGIIGGERWDGANNNKWVASGLLFASAKDKEEVDNIAVNSGL
jgi:hypothetical protein